MIEGKCTNECTKLEPILPLLRFVAYSSVELLTVTCSGLEKIMPITNSKLFMQSDLDDITLFRTKHEKNRVFLKIVISVKKG